MRDPFYRIQLVDCSLKNVFPAAKPYFGTLDQIGELIDHLAADQSTAIRYCSTIYSFHSFLHGNKNATHTIAGETTPLLTPVKLLHETTTLQYNPEWFFCNGVHTHCLRADTVNTHQILLQDEETFLRCIRPTYEGLQYRNPCEDWIDMGDDPNGFPYIYATDKGFHSLRLYVMEQIEMTPDPCLVQMRDPCFISHYEPFNDLFGGQMHDTVK